MAGLVEVGFSVQNNPKLIYHIFQMKNKNRTSQLTSLTDIYTVTDTLSVKARECG